MVDEGDNEVAKRLIEQGRWQERVENLKRDLVDTQIKTEARFQRLEDRISEGFRQGQLDREAGNKSLGELISAVTVEVKSLAQTINRGQGAISLGDKLIAMVVCIAAAAFGGWISHF